MSTLAPDRAAAPAAGESRDRQRPRRRRSATRRSSDAALLSLALLLLGAGVGRAGSPDQDLRRIREAELELSLAKQPDLYLVLDPPTKRLAVKARGMVLDQFPLQEVSQLVFHPLFGSASVPPLPAPAIWTVTRGPGDADRETIAPTTLRPYSEQEEQAESAAPDDKKKDDTEGDPRTPSSYRVGLDTGWQLMLVNQPPRLGWGRRFAASVADGWARLHGEEPSHPPLVTLVVSPEVARQLHHLFRTGMPILVAPS